MAVTSSHDSGSSRLVAIAAGATLFVVYCVTLARGMTYWDAAELLAAIHSLGIPHPPGTPVFVLVGRVWSMIFAPVVGFAIAVNAFSAFSASAACALIAYLFDRWTRDTLAAYCAALTAGLMSTLWLNATETEVYACTLAMAMCILACAAQADSSREERWTVLTLYLCGLAWALHLTALLSVPVALYFIARCRPRPATIARGLALSIVGGSGILFMLIRARHDPGINQGNPATIGALIAAVQRHQYDVAPLFPRRAPLWLQTANVFQYADWQIALGLAPDPPFSPLRTLFTVAYAAFGIYGSLRHRAADRVSWRAWLIFLITTSLCVMLYLNEWAGASFGYGVLPDAARHEARDRDYFYVAAFTCWGAWAGFGVIALARALVARMATVFARRAALAAGVLIAALPLATNWRIVHAMRVDEQRADFAKSLAMMQAIPPRGVFIAIGDNDTYPLWYLQQAEGMRRDVTVVSVPLIATEWDRAELVRRDSLLDTAYVAQWHGMVATVNDVRARAAALHRPVAVSPYMALSPIKY